MTCGHPYTDLRGTWHVCTEASDHAGYHRGASGFEWGAATMFTLTADTNDDESADQGSLFTVSGDTETSAALTRLIAVALSDTEQSRHCADFLLAWWNASVYGGFNLTALWACDRAIVEDMRRVFGFIGQHAHYPEALGYGPRFRQIARTWRPVTES